MTRVEIKTYRGDALIDAQVYAQDVIKIGRLPSAHLRLVDPAIARAHAVLEIVADRADLIVADARASTAVNGRALVGSRRLAAGDVVEIGPFRVEVAVLTAGGDAGRHPSIGRSEPPAPAAASSSYETCSIEHVESAGRRRGGAPPIVVVALGLGLASAAVELSILQAEIYRLLAVLYMSEWTGCFGSGASGDDRLALGLVVGLGLALAALASARPGRAPRWRTSWPLAASWVAASTELSASFAPDA